MKELAKDKQWYKTEIVKMVEEIENPDYSFKIYHYVLAKYRRENKSKETEN